MTGSVAFDTIMEFAGRFGDYILPEKTNELNVAFLVERLEQRRGGTAANIAFSMAMLGERPLLCAAVGGGDFVDYAAALEAEGVDMSGVLTCDDVSTATAFITTDRDGNQITAFHPGAMARAAGVDLSAHGDVSEVVVGADDAAAMALHVEQARALGARLVFVPAQQIPAMPDEVLRRGLEQAWLVGGQRLRVRDDPRPNRSVDRLRCSASRMVAVTHGPAGSELRTPDGVVGDSCGAGQPRWSIRPAPAMRISPGVVTGFRAGASPEVAGRMGSLAAAYVVEQHGPQRHRFDPASFRDRYAAAFGVSLSVQSEGWA